MALAFLLAAPAVVVVVAVRVGQQVAGDSAAETQLGGVGPWLLILTLLL